MDSREGRWGQEETLPVAAGTKRSFDGRYMGPVDISAIEGIARPIVTFP